MSSNEAKPNEKLNLSLPLSSPKTEERLKKNEVQFLKEEISRQNEWISKYTSGFPKYEEVHEKVRAETALRIDKETEIESLKGQIQLLQMQKKELERKLSNIEQEYQTNIKNMQDTYSIELSNHQRENKKIVNDLQNRLKRLDLQPKVEDFISNISKVCNQKFSDLDEIAEFLTDHEEKYKKELENMAKQCDKQCTKLAEQVEVMKTKNDCLLEGQKQQENDKVKLCEMIKNYKSQIKRIDVTSQQQIYAYEQENAHLKTACDSLKNQLEITETANGRLKLQNAELEKRYDTLSAKNAKLESQVQKLISQNSADADMRINERKKEAQHYNQEIERVLTELRMAKDEKLNVEKEHRDFVEFNEQTIEENKNLKEEIRTLNKTIEENRAKYIDLKAEYDSLEKEKERLKDEIETIHLDNQLSKSKSPNKNSKLITSNDPEDEVVSTYETIISDLRQDLSKALKTRDKLASLVLFQNNLLKKMEKVTQEHMKKLSKQAEDYVLEYIQQRIIPEFRQSEQSDLLKIFNNPDLESTNNPVTLTQIKRKMIKQIFQKMREKQNNAAAILCKEMISWATSYSQTSTNEDIIRQLKQFCKRNGNVDLENALYDIEDEQIGSINALKVISYLHSICKLQKADIRKYKESYEETDKVKENFKSTCDKLVIKCHKMQNKNKKLKEVLATLKNELAIRMKQQNDQKTLYNNSKASFAHLNSEYEKQKEELRKANEERNELRILVNDLKERINEKEEEIKDYEQQKELVNAAINEQKAKNDIIVNSLKKEIQKQKKMQQVKDHQVDKLSSRLNNQSKKHRMEIESLQKNYRESAIVNDKFNSETEVLQKRLKDSEKAYSALQIRLNEANHHAEELQKDLVSTRMEKRTLESKLRSRGSPNLIFGEVISPLH